MSKSDITEDAIKQLKIEILTSGKYRQLDLPQATIENLIEQELSHYKHLKDLKQAVKKKLHMIVAPYLGDPDYHQASIDLQEAMTGGQHAVKNFCLTMLQSHASTRERLPFIDTFYPSIFAITGMPANILDLACGLNPFALPWMHLPTTTNYFAYDIHRPRVDLLNLFFDSYHPQGKAVCTDIFVNPPSTNADVAFFFKEAHRLEQRQRGSNRQFWLSIPSSTLVISLPASSLTGKHDKIEQHQRLVYNTIDGLNWQVEEILVGNELVFVIQKNT